MTSQVLLNKKRKFIVFFLFNQHFILKVMILKTKIGENTIRKEEDFEGLLRSIRETQAKDENLFEASKHIIAIK